VIERKAITPTRPPWRQPWRLVGKCNGFARFAVLGDMLENGARDAAAHHGRRWGRTRSTQHKVDMVFPPAAAQMKAAMGCAACRADRGAYYAEKPPALLMPQVSGGC